MIPATLLKKGGPSGTAYSLLAVVEIGNSTLPTLLACWSCEMLLKMVLGPVGARRGLLRRSSPRRGQTMRCAS